MAVFSSKIVTYKGEKSHNQWEVATHWPVFSPVLVRLMSSMIAVASSIELTVSNIEKKRR